MKQQIVDIFPPEFYKNTAYWRGFVLALVYLVIAVAQLFTYEDFADVVTEYGLVGGQMSVVIIAALLPLLEVSALPFLLSMKMGTPLRTVSRVAVIAAPALWLVVSIATNTTGGYIINSGLFGATLPTINGWWLVVFAGLLLWSAILVVRELPERK